MIRKSKLGETKKYIYKNIMKHKNGSKSNNSHNKPKYIKVKTHKLNTISRNKYEEKHRLVKELSRQSHRQSRYTPKNYIHELVNLYYNNDNVVNKFSEYKKTKQHIFPEHRRVVVIGDIHGDLDVAIKCLILAKCINDIKVPQNKSVSSMNNFFKELKWIGDDTYIVQLGDQIDRVRPQNWDQNEVTRDSAFKDEGSTLEIFYLFYHLDNLARQHNGRVFSILGNHEIMNVEGDFRYVSLEEFKCFKEHLETVYHRNSKFPYHSRTLKNNSYKLENENANENANENENNNNKNHTYAKLPSGYRERLYAFSPTGLCANMLGCNNYTILQIGNWLFCHGSPVLKILKKYTTDMLNNYVSMYLIGMDNDTTDSNKQDTGEPSLEKHYHNITRSSSKSVLWNRDFGETEIDDNLEDTLLTQLDIILEEYNNKNKEGQMKNGSPATHIAVGHTIQDTDKQGINSICEGRVWRCDVAMSKAFGDNKISKYRQPQVLEILNGVTTTVLI